MTNNLVLKVVTTTLPFDKFWDWLKTHSNCILRAGTSEAVLYDDDNFHWDLSGTDADPWVVRMMLGKRPVGEFVLHPAHIAYVQVEPGEDDEHMFTLVSDAQGTPPQQNASYLFVLAHGYEDDMMANSNRWTH